MNRAEWGQRVWLDRPQFEPVGDEGLEVVGVGGGEFGTGKDGGGGDHHVHAGAAFGTGEVVKFAGEGGGFIIEGNNAAGEHAKEDFIAHGIDRP